MTVLRTKSQKSEAEEALEMLAQHFDIFPSLTPVDLAKAIMAKAQNSDEATLTLENLCVAISEYDEGLGDEDVEYALDEIIKRAEKAQAVKRKARGKRKKK